jgi:hypothetical protein
MTETINSTPAQHLPSFITPPGQTDVLMVVMMITLLLIVVGVGVFYFRLHALPEHLASNGEKVQFEIVAVLALLALFTHNHIYWIAALLLAFIQIPDFMTPLSRMADALTAIARSRQPSASTMPVASPEPEAPVKPRQRKRSAEAQAGEKSDA